MNYDIVKKIEDRARTYHQDSSACHDWTHVDRVRNLALNLGKKEGADLFVLEIASLLHDICKNDEMKKKGCFCHATEGAIEA